MLSKFGLILAASFGIVVVAVGKADAQIITAQANAQAGPPLTAKPSGTYSVPAGNPRPQYQIVCDYGTIPNGSFMPMPGGPAPVPTALNPGAGAGPFSWSQANAVNINNPPAGLHLRARLQSWVAAQNRWFTEATVYAPVTAAQGGGGGPGGGD